MSLGGLFMTNEDLSRGIKDYSKALRAIGDGLEALQAELIEITCEGENYIVRAKTRRQLSKVSLLNDLRNVGFRIMWEILPERYPWSPVDMKLSYTPEDVERLESAGQARRENAGTPDPHSMRTALRVIGAHIDSKDARLRQIHRDGESMVIQYETSQGDCHREELTPSSLYALFVEMYAKRSSHGSKGGQEAEASQGETWDDLITVKSS